MGLEEAALSSERHRSSESGKLMKITNATEKTLLQKKLKMRRSRTAS